MNGTSGKPQEATPQSADAARALLRLPAWAWGALAGFGAAVNLTMLAGPAFMLLVYDRVLGAGTAADLAGLFLLVCLAHAGMTVLDAARLRLSARLGARMLFRLEPAVLAAAARRRAQSPSCPAARRAPADAEALCRPLFGPGVAALTDAPWLPLLLAVLFVVHPWLGWATLAGALAVLAAGMGPRIGQPGLRARQALASQAAGAALDRAAVACAGGLRGRPAADWSKARSDGALAALQLAEGEAMANALSRGLRLWLQSAILALGALLVLNGQIGAGAMIAATLLAGRALAPLDVLPSQWPVLCEARQARRRLHDLLLPDPAMALQLPAFPAVAPDPSEGLELADVVAVPPGAALPAVQRVSLRLLPGQALGLIGPAGAGKSVLAAVLTGRMAPVAGCVLLGGVPLARIDADTRAALIGHLPQAPRALPGSIADNIALAHPAATPAALMAAARLAGLDATIARLPAGWDTRLDHDGAPLSGGAFQRLALARALLGAPLLVVLDEPAAHLDDTGCAALTAAVHALKARGAMVVIASQRPAAVAGCDRLLRLEAGIPLQAGPAGPVSARLPAGHAA